MYDSAVAGIRISIRNQINCGLDNKLTQHKKRALQPDDDNDDIHARSKKKKRCLSIVDVIEEFHIKVKNGPNYVCTVCHRLMYKESVISYNKLKYVKASAELLASVFNARFEYISFDNKIWVCNCCDRSLMRGNMPLQAKANGFSLPEIPQELSSLNVLELRLISLRIPFMKLVALPAGKQRRIHGPAINVLSKLDTVCTMLPRLPSESVLIPLKLKRMLCYKGDYI
jgi:hypothetical protein